MAVAERTGGADTEQWIRSRYAAALGIVRVAVDLTDVYDEGAEGDAERERLRASIAVCAVAWWGVACDWGSLEHNHNPGTVPCPADGGVSDCVEYSADWGVQRVQAFASLEDGAAAWFAWVRRTSAIVWEQLEVAALGYWRAFDVALGRTAPTWEVAADAFDRVARAVAVAPLADWERTDLEFEWGGLRRTGISPGPRTPDPPVRRRPVVDGADVGSGTGREFRPPAGGGAGNPPARTGSNLAAMVMVGGLLAKVFGLW